MLPGQSNPLLLKSAVLIRDRPESAWRACGDEIAVTPDIRRLRRRPPALQEELQHVSRWEAMI
jgi:hypothetical protein